MERLRAREHLRVRFLWVLKHSLNRVTRRLALAGVGPFSLVEHRGRRSGREYQTPVILARVPAGFVAELTYGERVDWWRNVAAAGGCTVVHRGRRHPISGVETYPAARGLAAFPAPARLVLRVLGRDEFRLLRRDDEAAG
jgi:deazaflavin-dependent oxidoreductase (nitroreductase family)